MITKKQALTLTHGQILFHLYDTNADGSPVRWRVNGKVKTWKTRPDDFQVPIKYGLRSYDYLTHETNHLLCLTEDEVKLRKKWKEEDCKRNVWECYDMSSEVM